MTARVPRLPFSLDPLIAEAKQRMRRRRLLLAAMFALVAATTAGVIASGEARPVADPIRPNGAGATALCPAPNPYGVWAYQTPASPRFTGDHYGQHGLALVTHPIKVGDVLGRWKVTAIAALPDDCKTEYVLPPGINQPDRGILNGRLILQRVR